MEGFINKCRYKRVITLSEKEVKKIVIELLDVLEETGMKSPSYVVSILNGGRYIGDVVYHKYEGCVEKKEVLLRRFGTKKKDCRFIRWILRKIPYLVLDVLRNIEDCLLQLFPLNQTLLDEEIYDIILHCIGDINRKRVSTEFPILIVDDAVDSGSTIRIIKEVLIKKVGIEKECIKILVLVKTRENSAIEPDVVKYRNVLVRFPWSKDFKG